MTAVTAPRPPWHWQPLCQFAVLCAELLLGPPPRSSKTPTGMPICSEFRFSVCICVLSCSCRKDHVSQCAVFTTSCSHERKSGSDPQTPQVWRQEKTAGPPCTAYTY